MLLTVVVFSEALEDLKGRLEPWKEALKSNRLRVNVKKMKMMISSENVGKVTEEGTFPCPIFRKGLGSNSIFCYLSRCWVRKIYWYN